ncbi:TonB-linked SusC/RagA family outer membrane protein [Dysgonomonas sp. PFB1-18]|uniref:SusC/RagA family TonB-linked outer membrane protein n=1 Tax=unclassified Dysgonomonas TaxID=2630389 RepID=UPI002475CB34|nr:MULTISPECIES: SusC/RagA family TonB-linked outer membrane protein [unclassified Dysgonomonas]MDH6307644.1 TonB-linked SusC/RagA family outer membrane protein [Dysgonomonas sp. PF1-14]MDH6337562.1 TonB-linked SusC/RagA family outer membrane protein [Dysgonomonas sp. PF1-16]MDH6378786.1 TonB-linked SusC/RagA family outer membrane protein [Dysgonomonas sp. PFB1-18]MDH6399204.1 TonB-linked SusC/RagA family outer membrane protein [Dysgonomonas sp. PF1-23]
MNKRVMLILSCLLLSVGFIVAQTTRVSGTVVDSNQEPVISASVVVKGTTVGTVTDLDGNFSINVPDGRNTLVFTLVGMKTVEARATQGMKVIMANDDQILDEVVVVAYGVSKKEALTGSVSAISASDIVKRPVSNVGSALEGMGTGIQVSSSFGEPGQAPTIRIRGFSSLVGANDPLIILDGSTYTGNIANINPDDIENISVLKDAASTALYGSRGANGVILITTKRAKAGSKGSMTVSIRQGITNKAMPEYDRMGADQFMQASWTSYRNGLMTSRPNLSMEEANALANTGIISSILRYNIYDVPNDELFDEDGIFNPNAKILPGIAGDLDWFKDMERTGYRQDYNLSGSVATDKLSLFYSFGYLNEKGYVKTSDYERLTGRINASYSPRKWLKTGLTLSGTYEKRHRTVGDGGNSYVNVFYNARTMSPIYPVHLHNMETGDYILDVDGNKQYDTGEANRRPQYTARHAIWENQLNKYEVKTNRTTIEPFMEFSFLNDFKFLVKGNMSIRTSADTRYGNSIIGDGAGVGRSYLYDYDFKEYTTSQQLSWARTFKDVHNLDAVLVHEYNSWFRDYKYLFKQGESLPNLTDFVNFSTTNALDSYRARYNLESYLGRIRYNYDEKYFVEGSYRRDGTSMFHKDTRWGGFWSAGASWIISREAFMSDLRWVNMLKTRISYGEVGNTGFDPSINGNYQMYQDQYSLDFNGGTGAVFRSLISEPTLTWEAMKSFSVGLDTRLFNRINFSFDYFSKVNEDLLLDVVKPLSSGSVTSSTPASPVVRMNAGTMKNYGFELALDGDVIKNRDWTWNLGADVTFLKNKITKLTDQMSKNGQINGWSRWKEGLSRYDLYLYQWAGVDQMTGESLYYLDPAQEKAAINAKRYVEIQGKKYTTQASYALRENSGSAIPDAYGSIKTSLAYKDFSLSVLCTYGIGGKAVDGNYADYMSMGATPSAVHKDLAKAWTGVPVGLTETSSNRIDKNGVPALNNTKNAYNHSAISTRFLTNASYFYFKNVSLSYNFPKFITNKLDLNGLTIGANIENLAYFTKRKGFDPQRSFNGESDYQFVPARTFSFSLNITL